VPQVGIPDHKAWFWFGPGYGCQSLSSSSR
jgi:hypothetical protein